MMEMDDRDMSFAIAGRSQKDFLNNYPDYQWDEVLKILLIAGIQCIENHFEIQPTLEQMRRIFVNPKTNGSPIIASQHKRVTMEEPQQYNHHQHQPMRSIISTPKPNTFTDITNNSVNSILPPPLSTIKKSLKASDKIKILPNSNTATIVTENNKLTLPDRPSIEEDSEDEQNHLENQYITNTKLGSSKYQFNQSQHYNNEQHPNHHHNNTTIVEKYDSVNYNQQENIEPNIQYDNTNYDHSIDDQNQLVKSNYLQQTQKLFDKSHQLIKSVNNYKGDKSTIDKQQQQSFINSTTVQPLKQSVGTFLNYEQEQPTMKNTLNYGQQSYMMNQQGKVQFDKSTKFNNLSATSLPPSEQTLSPLQQSNMLSSSNFNQINPSFFNSDSLISHNGNITLNNNNSSKSTASKRFSQSQFKVNESSHNITNNDSLAQDKYEFSIGNMSDYQLQQSNISQQPQQSQFQQSKYQQQQPQEQQPEDDSFNVSESLNNLSLSMFSNNNQSQLSKKSTSSNNVQYYTPTSRSSMAPFHNHTHHHYHGHGASEEELEIVELDPQHIEEKSFFNSGYKFSLSQY
ncbi:myb domain-containing protein [Tieghemostelium lacteum]|uniref:Myb domain-containing protein n=1 Tax=Tieghemostelium lacteum TaxID=361077 RepID=A0A151ZHL9_TIELA|nr:myb domain-containing protein [Tieghemostelium lacteum]|eukprot:KYQ93405.1 myb domain-containing protein [Tieghemostelium lacteum]